MHSHRILLCALGSLGDLHPFLALGQHLQARGHRVKVASLERYQPTICELGFDFAPIRAFVDMEDKAELQRIMHLRKGSEYLIRDVVFRHVHEVYADVLAATDDVDMVLTGEILYVAQLAAEVKGLPWGFCALSPISFFSLADVSLLPVAGALADYPLSQSLNRALIRVGKVISQRWGQPWHALRHELGLPQRPNPVIEGKFSPHFNLALFSQVLAAPQKDWPQPTFQSGFAFYDAPEALPPALVDFLAAGPAPVVFTLGSAAVHAPGDFYKESLEAIQRLGCRGVLLMGDNPPPETLPDTVLALPYAPFGKLFAHARCVVHQGGVGTCGQALAAGVPALVVPYSHDQPDNALRLKRLGAALVLARKAYRADRVVPLLEQLLTPQYAQQAQLAAQRMAREPGALGAVEAIERFLLRWDAMVQN